MFLGAALHATDDALIWSLVWIPIFMASGVTMHFSGSILQPSPFLNRALMGISVAMLFADRA